MSKKTTQPAIADLVDFYKCWPDLRVTAMKLKKNNALAEKDIEVLDWMIRVVDRVGPADLKGDV